MMLLIPISQKDGMPEIIMRYVLDRKRLGLTPEDKVFPGEQRGAVQFFLCTLIWSGQIFDEIYFNCLWKHLYHLVPD